MWQLLVKAHSYICHKSVVENCLLCYYVHISSFVVAFSNISGINMAIYGKYPICSFKNQTVKLQGLLGQKKSSHTDLLARLVVKTYTTCWGGRGCRSVRMLGPWPEPNPGPPGSVTWPVADETGWPWLGHITCSPEQVL